MNDKKPETPKQSGQYMGAGIAIGVGLGVVFGGEAGQDDDVHRGFRTMWISSGREF